MYKMSPALLDALKNSDEPSTVIERFLNDEIVPDSMHFLVDFCESAGYPDEDSCPEYRVDDTEIKDGICLFSCTVFFTEKVYGGGCPDRPTTNPIVASCDCTINLKSGDIEWPQKMIW